jgi:hypothetical protein
MGEIRGKEFAVPPAPSTPSYVIGLPFLPSNSTFI